MENKKTYLVYQNDTTIFAIETKDKETVSKALIDYFDGDEYIAISKISDNGEFLFYEYVECEFSIKEIKKF